MFSSKDAGTRGVRVQEAESRRRPYALHKINSGWNSLNAKLLEDDIGTPT